jgi:hypothetical protein
MTLAIFWPFLIFEPQLRQQNAAFYRQSYPSPLCADVICEPSLGDIPSHLIVGCISHRKCLIENPEGHRNGLLNLFIKISYNTMYNIKP